MNQKEFNDVVKNFKKIEDARDQLWDRAQSMIEKDFEVEAYVLILATWNFARFRYFMKSFDLRNFSETIKQINPYFKRIKALNFEEADFEDEMLVLDIKFIYERLKKIAEQTGASKILALKNEKLFIMWDTKIRKLYNIDNKGSFEDYIIFLKKMKIIFKGIKRPNENISLAKAIDEYNYVITQGIKK